MGMCLRLNMKVVVDLDRADDRLSLNIINQFKQTGPMELTRAEAMVLGISILEAARAIGGSDELGVHQK